MSKGKGRKIGVRDVDGHKGEEVGEGEQKEGEQPGKVQVILINIWYYGFNPLIVGGIGWSQIINIGCKTVKPRYEPNK